MQVMPVVLRVFFSAVARLPRVQLYELSKNPKEPQNLCEAGPTIVPRLKTRLAERIAATP